VTDRLRAWLDEAGNCPSDHPELFAALRAVVELCDDSWPSLLKPNDVIRAIEKEIEKEVFDAE
jgi:hypothetical protein